VTYMKPTDFSKHLSHYLLSFLPGQRNMSSNTIRSYRDTFKLMLTFSKTRKKILPEKLTLEMITKEYILEFLDWLESERNSSISSRNQRLAAIRAFFRYVQSEEPSGMYQYQQIISISQKKHKKGVVTHLSPEAVQLLLSYPDKKTKTGRRDLTVLSVLYDTGARVQELIDLTPRSIRFDAPAVISLTGKGAKTRHVPMMQATSEMLRGYMNENGLSLPGKADTPLFYNRQNNKLTREGIAYILDKYVALSKNQHDIFPERVTPHVLRHTKAMHLLQAGINIVYIRDILGHVDIKTTEIYARMDSEMKRKALENAYPNMNNTDLPEWNTDNDLMGWLEEMKF
jgi:site-specific recombinase XerD